MSTEHPLLELRDVQRTFSVSCGFLHRKQPLRAVSGVSLKLQRGEVLGLVGESGCGKSTLALMALGLLQPGAGEILIDGKPMSVHTRSAIARRIQPIFQDPYSTLNPRKTIGAIVSLPLRVHRVGAPQTWRKTTQEMLERVGLPARVHDSYPNQLSGGQRQRVAIARALVMRPELVICDEPTSALDVSVQAQILNLLIELRRELNLTYLLISHNLAVVEHLATRVAVMYLGRIVEESATGQVFGQPRHPYTTALLKSILTPTPGSGVPDTRLDGAFPNPLDPPTGCSFHPRCAEAMPLCSRSAPRPLVDARGMVECHLYDGCTVDIAPENREGEAATATK
ncbi:MAG TPA: ABC transporter ATP-binding protein [Burkholderiales bacterium]|nr:ABC transporter ATP-binding protein [Burkholderiales bacterium]